MNLRWNHRVELNPRRRTAHSESYLATQIILILNTKQYKVLTV